jgi:hypothetical protein
VTDEDAAEICIPQDMLGGRIDGGVQPEHKYMVGRVRGLGSGRAHRGMATCLLQPAGLEADSEPLLQHFWHLWLY